METDPIYGHQQVLIPVVQGGTDRKLRKQSASELCELDAEVDAIGGLAVGEPKPKMLETVAWMDQFLPRDKPRYLMGVGTPADIVEGVIRGIDMFDCVMPTRSGRTGKGFTPRGEINIRNARHAEDPRQLNDNCKCPVCNNYSRAYLHHLFKANEMLGPMLLTRHNLTYYQDLMHSIRNSISNNDLSGFIKNFYRDKLKGDVEPLETEVHH